MGSEIAQGDVLVPVVTHKVAVIPDFLVAAIHHIHTLLVGHLQRDDVHYQLQFLEQVVTLSEQFSITVGDGDQLFRTEVRVREHLLVVLHIDIGDFSDHQNRLLYPLGVPHEVVHLFQGIVVLFTLIVELLDLLKVVKRVLDRLGSLHDFLGRVDDALCKIGGVCDHPLGVCAAC